MHCRCSGVRSAHHHHQQQRHEDQPTCCRSRRSFFSLRSLSRAPPRGRGRPRRRGRPSPPLCWFSKPEGACCCASLASAGVGRPSSCPSDMVAVLRRRSVRCSRPRADCTRCGTSDQTACLLELSMRSVTRAATPARHLLTQINLHTAYVTFGQRCKR